MKNEPSKKSVLVVGVATLLASLAQAADVRYWGFNTNGNAEGWTLAGTAGSLSVSAGALTAQSTGGDPQVISPDNIHLYAPAQPVVEVRMSATAGATAQLFFQTENDPTFTTPKSLAPIPINADGQFHSYFFAVSLNPHWAGFIRRLRVDPCNAAGTFKIDYVRVAASGGQQWLWDTAGNFENWTASNVTTGSFQNPGGYVKGTAAANGDPHINVLGLGIEAATVPQVELRMKTSAGSLGAVFWATDVEPAIDSVKKVEFTTIPDGQYHTYVVVLKDNDRWQGKVTTFRLDPTTTSGATFEVDYLKLVSSSGAIWGFNDDGNFEGWTHTADAGNPGVTGGVLNFTATGNDPQFILLSDGSANGHKLNADLFKTLQVKMRNDVYSDFVFLWQRTSDTGWGLDRAAGFPLVSPDGTTHTYNIDLSGFATWTGTIRDLRIDPLTVAGAASIDTIKFLRTTIVEADAPTGGDDGPMLRNKIADAIAAPSPKVLLLRDAAYKISSVVADGNADYCLLVDGATDLTIRGDGPSSKITVQAPTAGCLRMVNCTRTRVAGFTIDYNPLPFTQGVIEAKNLAAGWLKVNLDSTYPLLSASQFDEDVNLNVNLSSALMTVNGAIRQLKNNTQPAPYTSFALVNGTTDTFYVYYNVSDPSQLGYKLINNATVNGKIFLAARRSDAHGLNFIKCTDSGSGNVKILAAPALGCVNDRGSGMTFKGMTIAYADGTRLRTTCADAFMNPDNRGGPVIEDCVFEGMFDDGISVDGRRKAIYQRVPLGADGIVGTADDNTRVIITGIAEIQQYDVLQVYDWTLGHVRKNLTVQAVSLLEVLPAGGLKYQIDYSPAYAIPTGEIVMFNLNTSGSGFLVTRNSISWNRGVGMNLYGYGVASENVIHGSQNAGIFLNHFLTSDWEMGPVAVNMLLADNVISNCSYGTSNIADPTNPAAIEIGLRFVNGTATNYRDSTDITLIGNSIIQCWNNGIRVGAATDVTITDTTVDSTGAGIVTGNTSGIVLEKCGNITIDTLLVKDTRTNSKAGLWIKSNVSPGLAPTGVTHTNKTFYLAAGVPGVLDDR